jgi:hypothetical protein
MLEHDPEKHAPDAILMLLRQSEMPIQTKIISR